MVLAIVATIIIAMVATMIVTTGRKGVVWSGIWGVDIIPQYNMVLRSYI